MERSSEFTSVVKEKNIVPNDITNARRRDEYIDGLLGLLDESHAFVNKFVAEVHKGRTQFNMLFLEAKALARKIETMKKGKDGTT